MVKYFVFTTGRTGSTAICDELNSRDDMVCWQELFNTIYGHHLEQDNVTLSGEEEHFQEFGLPCQVYQGLNPGTTVADFLAYTEDRSAGMAAAMGFKLLYYEPELWEGGRLLWQLKERGYKCLHLIRRDHTSRTLSSLIASTSGYYNTKETVEWGTEKILIDPLQFEVRLKYGMSQIEEARESLEAAGLPTLEIFYEDFLADPNAFHRMISGHFDLTTETRKASGYKKTTPSRVSDLIENYDEILKTADDIINRSPAA